MSEEAVKNPGQETAQRIFNTLQSHLLADIWEMQAERNDLCKLIEQLMAFELEPLYDPDEIGVTRSDADEARERLERLQRQISRQYRILFFLQREAN